MLEAVGGSNIWADFDLTFVELVDKAAADALSVVAAGATPAEVALRFSNAAVLLEDDDCALGNSERSCW